MKKKSAKGNRIEGDVNLKNGDVVAGNKTVVHGDDDNEPDADTSSRNKRARPVKSRHINGSLDVSGGDVVFGDKIIKFFQDNLNIYLFKDVQQLLLFLLFVVVVSATLGGAYWYSKQPKRMTGDYNIAIAQFGEMQPNGIIQPSAKAEQISQLLFDYLDSEYQAAALGLNVQ